MQPLRDIGWADRRFPGCAARPWAAEYNPFGVKPKTVVGEFNDKQRFLNTPYERFFRGYSMKPADTHGITGAPGPQEFVDSPVINGEHCR